MKVKDLIGIAGTNCIIFGSSLWIEINNYSDWLDLDDQVRNLEVWNIGNHMGKPILKIAVIDWE